MMREPDGRVPGPAAPGGERGTAGSAAPKRPRRGERIARRLPDWAGSIRFRLTALYSLVLFGLAAVVVGGVYLAVAARLHDRPVSREFVVTACQPRLGGAEIECARRSVVFESLEREVNQRTVQVLRTYSFGALALLFLASMVVGWVVAGRVLAPIDRIAAVAREIQATDLSRRIALRGPPDELRNLADTFDGMLERIDDAFESQRRFIQEASHELRNPLAVMRTNLDVALADPEASLDDVRRSAEVAQRATERMTHLVDDLLAYARHGAPERRFEPVDLAGTVRDAAAEFAAPAAARGLRLEAEPGTDLWVVGDRVALRQALDNLLANAVRLAPAGSEVRLATGRRDAWLWAAVADQGPGIPAEQRDMVFQRFWRADHRRAREEGRSGLGLAIVRQIAESHRGEIRLHENEHGGSTFTLWLPAAPAAAASTEPETATPAMAPEAATAGTPAMAPEAATAGTPATRANAPTAPAPRAVAAADTAATGVAVAPTASPPPSPPPPPSPSSPDRPGPGSSGGAAGASGTEVPGATD
ncbi:MAG: HAMP domain-containing histidine kinase [Actinobacteria bacterium]|nr:HAMP domain-containing histidine kinase [Actinomycetota bacterium]